MWHRHKLRVNWHRLLKEDDIARENGFHKRLFKQTEIYDSMLAWWDYPARGAERNWKSQRKTQYKGS